MTPPRMNNRHGWDAVNVAGIALLLAVSHGRPIIWWVSVVNALALAGIAVRLWRRGYGHGQPTSSHTVTLRLADLSPEQREDAINANRQITAAMHRLAEIANTQR